jgi:predicted nucleic acid-binding protein
LKYLLDTNIVSAVRKKKAEPKVVTWVNSISSEHLFISVITIGEIKRGIEKVKDTKKQAELTLWLDQELRPWFGENILTIDLEIAEKWGQITSSPTLPAIDSLIAATALAKNLTLVTRNSSDFSIPGLRVFNPY